jgi:hypothetical protein
MIFELTLLMFLSNTDDTDFSFLAAMLRDTVTRELIEMHLRRLIQADIIVLSAAHAKEPTFIGGGYGLEFVGISNSSAKNTPAIRYPTGSRPTTVHMQKKHKIRLQFPSLPCISALGGYVKDSKPKKRSPAEFAMETLLVRLEGTYVEIFHNMKLHAHRWGPTPYQFNIPAELKPVADQELNPAQEMAQTPIKKEIPSMKTPKPLEPSAPPLQEATTQTNGEQPRIPSPTAWQTPPSSPRASRVQQPPQPRRSDARPLQITHQQTTRYETTFPWSDQRWTPDGTFGYRQRRAQAERTIKENRHRRPNVIDIIEAQRFRDNRRAATDANGWPIDHTPVFRCPDRRRTVHDATTRNAAQAFIQQENDWFGENDFAEILINDNNPVKEWNEAVLQRRDQNQNKQSAATQKKTRREKPVAAVKGFNKTTSPWDNAATSSWAVNFDDQPGPSHHPYDEVD